MVGVVLVLVLGFVSFTRMTTDLLPDMDLPYALIMTTDSGASPEEVERDVSSPIEAAMATTSNIKRVRSTSYDNYSVVILEYEQDTNMDSVLIEIQQKLDQIKGNWKDNVGSPTVMQLDPDMMPIMIAAANVKGMGQTEVTEYVKNQLVPAIESVEGVASATATGTLGQEVQVIMNQKNIDKLNKKIQQKIDEKFKDAESKLDETEKQISDGKQQLSDGEKQLSDKVSSGANKIINNKIELAKKEQELANQLAKLKESKASINAAITNLQDVYQNASKLEGSIKKLEKETGGSIQLTEINVDKTKDLLEKAVLLEKQKVELELLNAQLVAQSSLLAEQSGVKLNSYKDIPNIIAGLSKNLTKINAGIKNLESAQSQIASGKVSLDDAYEKLNQTQMENMLQMSKTSAKLEDATVQLQEGKKQLDTSKESAKESTDLDAILTIDNLNKILMAQNFSMPAGYAGEGQDRYLVRVGDKVSSVKDLQNLVLVDLGMEGIDPIRLCDVADVSLKEEEIQNYSKVNGNAAIMLSIEKQTGYSTGDVTKRLQTKFKSLQKADKKLDINVLMNQGVYIDIIVQSVLENMVVGAILAIMILLIFLKAIKPTLVIACSIPLSVVFAIVLMYFSKVSLNIISLSGLALGIGMLVDNSIVVIENIYRLRSEGYSVKKAAVEGARQVAGAIAASTLTTVCVFAPIIFTDGITKQLFVDIALTIAFTLGASLLVALTFVPMMAAGLMKNTKEIKHAFFDRIKEGYAKVLAVCLRFKILVFLVVIGLLAGSFKAALSRGFSFMDMEMNADQLTVTIRAKENQTLGFEELVQLSDEITQKISKVKGVKTIGAMAGGGSVLSGMGGGSGDSVSMYLVLDQNQNRKSKHIAKEIEDRTKKLNCEVEVSSGAAISGGLMGSGLSIQVKGPNLEKLQELAAKVADIAKKTEGTKKVSDGLEDTTNSFTVVVNKRKAARYNMTVAQVYQLVYGELAANKSSTTISTNLQDYEVYVQNEKQTSVTIDDIRKLQFVYKDMSGKEEKVPLSKIAVFKEGVSLNQINRDGQIRYINVSASVDEKHNVSLVSNQIKKQLKEIKLEEGYSIEMAGEDETIRESMNQLVLMLVLAVIFIYLIMVAQFQSLLSPFIIMFTIPLAFTGGLFALYITKNEISVIGMIGFVMLAGIIVNNGIVLVDYINQLRKQGMEKKEAIIEAGKTRLRPILMTALTTILAMSTMAIGYGSGSEMMQPMAIVTIGGLIYGTLLTVIVVPCIYDLFQRNKSMVEEEL